MPRRRGVQIEDGGADLADGPVQLLDGVLDHVGDPLAIGPGGDHRALQAHAGGEEPLNHVVVQILCDPVAIGEDVEQAVLALLLGEFERHRGKIGHRFETGDVLASHGSVPGARVTISTPVTVDVADNGSTTALPASPAPAEGSFVRVSVSTGRRDRRASSTGESERSIRT